VHKRIGSTILGLGIFLYPPAEVRLLQVFEGMGTFLFRLAGVSRVEGQALKSQRQRQGLFYENRLV